MRIIDTSELTPASIYRLGETEKLWVYNGLDCALTHEIDTELDSVLDPIAARTYKLSLALQAPILEMNMRGVAIDLAARDEAIRSLQQDLDKVDRGFDYLCLHIFNRVVNPASPKQVGDLFYSWLNLPVQKKRNTNGEYVASTDRESLEKLGQLYYPAKPFVNHILKSRDIAKQISTLSTALSPDGRFKTSLSIAGTKTGRLASSMADFSDGGNLQNIDKRIRKIFVADPGYKLCNVDLEQADARNIGAMVWNLFPEHMNKNGGLNYLDAAESGDLHTTVAKLCWRELPWPGDPKGDRELADQPFYREKSYRDLGKVLGHGSNFNGQPPQMSKHTKTDQRVIANFQERYFGSFPELRKRIEWVGNEILEKGYIITLYGRRRFFLKRRGDNKTLNEGCAFEPQSMTAEEINYAMLKVFNLRTRFPDLQMLLQVHDSLLLQYPEEYEALGVIPAIREAFKTILTLRAGRSFFVPCEVQVGWNWGYPEYDKETKKVIANPSGMIKYKGQDTRTRA